MQSIANCYWKLTRSYESSQSRGDRYLFCHATSNFLSAEYSVRRARPVTGPFGDDLPKGAIREAGLFRLHLVRRSVLGFAIARPFWRLADPPPAPVGSPLCPSGELAGQIAHYAIYVLPIAIPAVGIMAQFSRGEPLPVYRRPALRGRGEAREPRDRAFAREGDRGLNAIRQRFRARVMRTP